MHCLYEMAKSRLKTLVILTGVVTWMRPKNNGQWDEKYAIIAIQRKFTANTYLFSNFSTSWTNYCVETRPLPLPLQCLKEGDRFHLGTE